MKRRNSTFISSSWTKFNFLCMPNMFNCSKKYLKQPLCQLSALVFITLLLSPNFQFFMNFLDIIFCHFEILPILLLKTVNFLHHWSIIQRILQKNFVLFLKSPDKLNRTVAQTWNLAKTGLVTFSKRRKSYKIAKVKFTKYHFGLFL